MMRVLQVVSCVLFLRFFAIDGTDIVYYVTPVGLAFLNPDSSYTSNVTMGAPSAKPRNRVHKVTKRTDFIMEVGHKLDTFFLLPYSFPIGCVPNRVNTAAADSAQQKHEKFSLVEAYDLGNLLEFPEGVDCTITDEAENENSIKPKPTCRGGKLSVGCADRIPIHNSRQRHNSFASICFMVTLIFAVRILKATMVVHGFTAFPSSTLVHWTRTNRIGCRNPMAFFISQAPFQSQPGNKGVILYSTDKNEAEISSSPPSEKRIQGVTLKIALDQQGAVADLAEDKSERFTCGESLDMVHRLRRDSDAVLVGRSTVEIDDCTLTVRRVDPAMVAGKPQQPVRVVVDPNLQLQLNDYKVFTDGLPTILVYCAEEDKCSEHGYVNNTHEEFSNVTMLGTFSTNATPTGTTRLSAKSIVDVLHQACSIQHIMVEGGPNTALQFLSEGMVDRVILVKAPMTFREPLPSNITDKTFRAAGLQKMGSYKLGVDTIDCYSRPGVSWPNGVEISKWP
jgi:riboflavin-specific deaminase-like protein